MDDQPHNTDDRKMVLSELLGYHSHQSTSGTHVHVYRREGSYLARGRYEGRPFGKTLGKTEAEANVQLRRLLNALDNGSFVPPSQAARRPLKLTSRPRLTLEELADRYLVEKRSLKGEKTMKTYRSRLAPALAFASFARNRKRWPLAHDLDREFAMGLRSHLFGLQTTPNGKAGAKPKSLSVRQVYNIMEAVRGLLHWASGPAVSLLRQDFVNPFTREVVGERERKDPLRANAIPLDSRLQIALVLDCWQLGTLGLALALPLRPNELTGILISDVDLVRREIRVGTRLGGGDFTKGRQSFVMPLPEQLVPLVLACIDGRAEGPLLCRRTIWSGRAKPKREVYGADELQALFEDALARCQPGTVETEQDRKAVFRRVLRDLGGVDPDELAEEFKKAAAQVGIRNRLYDLRHGVTTDMHRAGVRHLELRYMTAHSTTDILNTYVPLDPHGEMAKYARHVRPLFDALLERGHDLGCLVGLAP